MGDVEGEVIEGYQHIPTHGVKCHKCGSMVRDVDDKGNITCRECGVWFGSLPAGADSVGRCISCLKDDLPVRHVPTALGGYMRVCFDCYERLWPGRE